MVETPEWIKKFEITTLFIISVGALVLLQVVSILITQVGQAIGRSPEQLKLGPAFLVLITGAAVWMTFEIIKKYRLGHITKPNIFMILLITAAVIAAYIYLPKVVPGIFEQAVMQLQSTLSGG